MRGLSGLLAALAMLGPFAIDMYLPSFPEMAGDFQVSAVDVQQTLTAYLAAFAIMNLLHGTISDVVGRRPIILSMLSIFAFASLGCAWASSMQR